MISFAPIRLQDREKYLPYLQAASHRGCAYSFVNLFLWGRQKAALVEKFPRGGFLLTGFALGIIMRSSKVSP